MENNSKSATPVNVEGFGPGLPALDVTIVAPLPVPVELITPLPVPVIIVPSATYPVKRQALSLGTLYVQNVLSAVPCELDLVFGFNSDPTATNLLYVQLHDAAAAVSAGAVPKVIIPVYGGKATYSCGPDGLEFSIGLVIALSTSELLYAASATAYLSYTAKLRTAV